MFAIGALLVLVGCIGGYLVWQRLLRLSNRRAQRQRIAAIPPARLHEEYVIASAIALRRLEEGFGSIVSPAQFWRCLDQAALLRQRMAARDGIAQGTEASWRRRVRRDLQDLKARRSAAGLPLLVQRGIPGRPESWARWVELAVSGRKHAVCWPSRQTDTESMTRLSVGDRAVYVGEFGEPLLAIECTGTRLCRFEDIDSDTALAEGEHDSFEAWRADRRGTFSELGLWCPDLPVVCERFRVVAQFRETGADQGT